MDPAPRHRGRLAAALIAGCAATLTLVAAAAAQLPPADLGDAPEGFPAYPNGTLGKFPTCMIPDAPGSQEAECGALSTPPGLTGFIRHLPSLTGSQYWLGCYDTPTGPGGMDSELLPKSSKAGFPGCDLAIDCLDAGPEWSIPPEPFGQDECYGDGADAGVLYQLLLVTNCGLTSQIPFKTYNAGAPVTVYLNVLVDMNVDGDWNDSFEACYGPCAREWAAKNVPLTLASGCADQQTPPFQAAYGRPVAYMNPGWLRITLTDQPVDDDFPWKGSAGRPEDAYRGGETEDYPVVMFEADPVRPSSWGAVKVIYR